MTTVAAHPPAQLLAQLRAQFVDSMPDQFERLRWPVEQIAAEQQVRLRRVLTAAIEDSPFHRRRLEQVRPATFTLDELSDLPVMTKSELMDNYDQAVTDRRVTLDGVNRHLAAVGEDPSLYLDEFIVLASGGSSGTRGVFVSDLGASAAQMAAVVRNGLAQVAELVGWPPPAPAPMAIVAAPTCVHATRALSSVFMHGGLADITFAPVTQPFDRILDVLSRAQPLILVGYPTVLARLADARRDGRLVIDPMVVSVTSEQLTDSDATRITGGFGIAPVNSYGTTEGLMGNTAPGSSVFDLASDLAIVELVDARDQPVAAGQTAHHVLVTSLLNTTQPLIRYRIDDAMTAAPSSPDHGHQRVTLAGRSDETLVIGEVQVHPHTIRSVLAACAAVADYQVRVTHGRDVDLDLLPARSPVEPDAVATSVRSALEAAGARPGSVRVAVVDTIPRDPRTGKARRFVTH